MVVKLQQKLLFKANMESLSSGQGIQVVRPSEEHTFLLDEEALQRLLLREDVRDRPVVLVSVAGAYRKGKSFLLDFFLRYLDRTYNNGEGGGEWLGREDEALKGFSWRGGSDRHTTGIHLWSQPFKASLSNGEKVVVLLMDTQGTFDSNSTVKDNATVFALSTMLSSVQIYNLSQNIEEDDLQHLQLFMEYGRVAKDEIGGKPFQRLQFLVRDWSYPYDHPYGAVGGEQLLKKRLTVREGQHEELQRVRQDIARCFEDVTCFLMPYPGTKVSTDPQFSGKLSDIDGEFKSCLKKLVPMLLAPENLVTKKIGGQTVKARDLLNYFKSYVEVFNSEELPNPMTILQATAEANNTSASSEARNVYETLMEEVCGGTKPYLSQEVLDDEHRKCLNKALHAFESKKKMGGAEMADKFKDLLVKDLEELFKQLSAHNEGKNVHSMLSTPLVFLALLLVGYLLSVLGSTFGVQTAVALGQAVTLGAAGMLAVWLYTRWTGSGREIGMQLDDIAIKIKSSVNFMMPPKPSHLSSSYEHSNTTSTHTDKKER
ncbi:hypothetical protein PYW07_007599 [Mythimna separata]|uniref:GB1/RHD3-type G domain-containing protein n=1 Tax=Mythimna separata TaxID=271217 RepID=A0AAD8DU35_MYTSE|nr:hypothetical protein PYW07_007599 [Mythimna separata]